MVNVFTVPDNGKVCYTFYYMLYAISMAGINSATINLIFDYVEKGKRTGALALKSTVCGFAGFFTTLIVSPLVGYVQQNNNELFGLPVYAQQVTSLISAVTLVVLIIYLNTVIRRIKKNENN